MKKNDIITINNTIRHYFNKIGYRVMEVNLEEPICYKNGDCGNWGAEVFFDKPYNWASYKNYKVYRRCEDRLMKKYGVELIID